MRRSSHLTAILFTVIGGMCVAAIHASAQASQGKAPTAADHRETDDWLWYGSGGTQAFRYPAGWKVKPILWQSAAQEAADEVGVTVEGQDGGVITLGGRGATACDEHIAPSSECKCLSIYTAVYICNQDANTRHIYDLLVTTIRNDSPNGDLTVIFPEAQAVLRPNRRYTLRWDMKSGTPHHNIDISVRDTSKYDWRQATVLDLKDVPNTGQYDWLVPASITSPGPYLFDISFVLPEQVEPPAQAGGHLYTGISSPFYIQ